MRTKMVQDMQRERVHVNICYENLQNIRTYFHFNRFYYLDIEFSVSPNIFVSIYVQVPTQYVSSM